MNYTVILAGGSGTRFWPLSRHDEPKQFLNICSDKPMIELAINRIRRLIPKNNIYIATNKIYHKKIEGCLKGLDIRRQNIFFEPQARNTFAPIGTLSNILYKQDKDAVILVLPCDHFIKNEKRFTKILNKSINLAKKGHIVTIGIAPDRPETGYGYIKISSKLPACPRGRKTKNSNIYKVDRFIEKPNLQKAKKMIKDKRFYWNGGIFIFRADTMLKEIKKFLPSDYRIIAQMKNKLALNKLWPRLTSISIDYAIMEKTKRLALITADFGWMDLGSWQAIEYFAKKDRSGNIFMGNCIDIGSSNTLAWSDKRLLATLGLNNIIIVDTKDAILVCSKDRTQEVKKIVQILKQKNLIKQI